MSSVVGDSQISSTKYRRHLIAAVELAVSCSELCKSGTPGIPGRDGPDGRDGNQGLRDSGMTGPAVPPGLQGTTRKTGVQVPSGKKGNAGMGQLV